MPPRRRHVGAAHPPANNVVRILDQIDVPVASGVRTISTVLLFLFVSAVLSLPTLETRIAAALCGSTFAFFSRLPFSTTFPPCIHPSFVAPQIYTPYVERDEVRVIIDIVEHTRFFVVAVGGKSEGKSTAVNHAAEILSHNHTVRVADCTKTSTAVSVVQELFVAQPSEGVFYADFISSVFQLPFGIVLLPAAPLPSFDELAKAVRHRAPQFPPPVLVVEMAEKLSVSHLELLFEFAKELADDNLGRFIFVFSPTEKLAVLSGFSLSRASIVSMSSLTRAQALEFLNKTGCTPTDAETVHQMLDGQLSYLLRPPVSEFCGGKLSLDGLVKHFTGLVHAAFEHVNELLDCKSGCACQAACAIRDKEWDFVGLARARSELRKKHLVTASVVDEFHKFDSRFILCYLERWCSCNNTGYAVIPAC